MSARKHKRTDLPAREAGLAQLEKLLFGRSKGETRITEVAVFSLSTDPKNPFYCWYVLSLEGADDECAIFYGLSELLRPEAIRKELTRVGCVMSKQRIDAEAVAELVCWLTCELAPESKASATDRQDDLRSLSRLLRFEVESVECVGETTVIRGGQFAPVVVTIKTAEQLLNPDKVADALWDDADIMVKSLGTQTDWLESAKRIARLAERGGDE